MSDSFYLRSIPHGVVGPLTSAEMAELQSSRRVHGRTLVAESEHGPWLALMYNQELRKHYSVKGWDLVGRIAVLGLVVLGAVWFASKGQGEVGVLFLAASGVCVLLTWNSIPTGPGDGLADEFETYQPFPHQPFPQNAEETSLPTVDWGAMRRAEKRKAEGGDISGVTVIAWGLILVGIAILGYFFMMDTTVETSVAGDVHNLHKAHNQLVGVIVGIGLAILGGVLVSKAKK